MKQDALSIGAIRVLVKRSYFNGVCRWISFYRFIRNGIGFNPNEYSLKLLEHNANVYTASTLVNQFNNVYEGISEFRATQDIELYEELLYSF